jgi:hypothetical protein
MKITIILRYPEPLKNNIITIRVSDGFIIIIIILVWIRQDNANQLSFAEVANFKINSGKSIYQRNKNDEN